ncbi:MAG: class I SAM-dependent methyltransferase [Bacteroidales bacterium]|nr:class I SAM-dependent methyltransferase [Bacteroidales bacterium]
MNDEYYNTRYIYDKGRSAVWRAVCEDLQKFVEEQSIVLDLAAGYCDFINNIKAQKKIAVDINSNSKTHCKRDVQFHESTITDLSFIEDDSIDVIFMSNILEHLDEPQIDAVINEIKRITKLNSKIIIIQPNYRHAFREYFDDYTHQKIFTHVSLADLFNARGFKTLCLRPRYLPLSIKSKLPKSYWLTKLYLNFPLKVFGKQMLAVFKRED